MNSRFRRIIFGTFLYVIFRATPFTRCEEFSPLCNAGINGKAVPSFQESLKTCLPLEAVENLSAVDVTEWIECAQFTASGEGGPLGQYLPYSFPDGQALGRMSAQDMRVHLDLSENLAGALYTFLVQISPNGGIDWPVFQSSAADEEEFSSRRPQLQKATAAAATTDLAAEDTYPPFDEDCQIPDLHLAYAELLGFTASGTFVEVGAFDGRSFSNTYQVGHPRCERPEADANRVHTASHETLIRHAYDGTTSTQTHTNARTH
jgi:hypothetical protein